MWGVFMVESTLLKVTWLQDKNKKPIKKNEKIVFGKH
jgi:hypothetical protein